MTSKLRPLPLPVIPLAGDVGLRSLARRPQPVPGRHLDSTLAPLSDPGEDGHMLNLLPVAAWWVMRAMYLLQPAAPMNVEASYGEVSSAISDAANADPLFEGRDGGYRTAALLVALAWHESSFRKDALGDHNRSVGLYQIQPPTAEVPLTLLTIPRDASVVAVRLVRHSLRACRARPLDERLSWYAQGNGACGPGEAGEPSTEALNASRIIFRAAARVMIKCPPPEKAQAR